MKKHNWILIIILGVLFTNCEPEERGQYPIDEQPPNPVRSPEVINVPGGAVINYTIPDDADLLYVKATYERLEGEIVEQKASVYSNQLKIEGIGKSRQVDVQLIAVDRSRNESAPVMVTTYPLDAPIYGMLDSISAFDDFGGITLNWYNPTEAEVVITVTTKDESGEWVEVENFYTKVKNGTGSVRGFEAEEREFGISIRDKWGNETETLFRTFLPLFEERIDPEGHFRRWNPPGINYSNYAAAYSIEKMWDDNISTRYLVNMASYPESFTFDMGQTAKFSRMKIYQSQARSELFSGQNIEIFELWGAESNEGLSDDLDGWTKLGRFQVKKPSGLPLGELTDEDVAAAAAGQEFNFDSDVPYVRYIRVIVYKNFSNGVWNTIADLQFWGTIKE